MKPLCGPGNPKPSLNLPIDTLMQWNDNRTTDHGRQSLTVSHDWLMNEQRMVDGTLRRYIVAGKRQWTTSWENLFSKDDAVADGYWAGESMWSFYLNTPGEFWLTLTYGDGTIERMLVMFENFDWSLMKRGSGIIGDLWIASCDLVEV